MDFTANITESSRELTKKEKVMAKDYSNAIAIDEQLNGDNASIIIHPTAFVVLDVHNERSKAEKDYRKYIIFDGDTKYVTGSTSFWTAFMAIWDEMDGEDFSIEVFRKPSRNYNGKYFISCSLIG